MIGVIVILVIIYIVSVFSLEMKFMDRGISSLVGLMICFCPVLNTVLFVMYCIRDLKKLEKDLEEIKESLRKEKE